MKLVMNEFEKANENYNEFKKKEKIKNSNMNKVILDLIGEVMTELINATTEDDFEIAMLYLVRAETKMTTTNYMARQFKLDVKEKWIENATTK